MLAFPFIVFNWGFRCPDFHPHVRSKVLEVEAFDPAGFSF